MTMPENEWWKGEQFWKPVHYRDPVNPEVFIDDLDIDEPAIIAETQRRERERIKERVKWMQETDMDQGENEILNHVLEIIDNEA